MEILDKRVLWTGIVYFISPLMLHAAWRQAVICAICMTAYSEAVILAFSMTKRRYPRYCQRVIPLFGVIFLLFGLFAKSGILPRLDQWPLWHQPLTVIAGTHQ